MAPAASPSKALCKWLPPTAPISPDCLESKGVKADPVPSPAPPPPPGPGNDESLNLNSNQVIPSQASPRKPSGTARERNLTFKNFNPPVKLDDSVLT